MRGDRSQPRVVARRWPGWAGTWIAAGMLALAACAGDGPCLRHSDCDPGLVCDPVGACVIAPDDAGADGDATLVIDGLPDDGALLDGAPDSAGDAGDDAGRDADAAPDGGVDAGIDHDAG